MIKVVALIIGLLAIKPILKYDVKADATTVYQDYKANKIKADAKYLNKRVLLHGIVQVQAANLWAVYLKIPDPEGLTARIDDDQLVVVPLYKPGDSFDLICIGEGLVFNLPLFLHCRLP